MRTLFPSLPVGKFGKAYTHHPQALIRRLGPLLWLDAADSDTITQSGGLVQYWYDKSAYGRRAQQSTSTRRPITGTRTLNGKNVLDFQGGQLLAIPNFITTPVPMTIFIVTQIDDPSPGSYGGQIINNRLTKGFLVNFEDTMATRFRYYNGSSTLALESKSAASAFGQDTGHILSLTWDGSVDATKVSSRTDGTEFSYVTQTSAASLEASDSTWFCIGGGADFQFTNTIDGAIGEIIMFDRVLSNYEMNQVGNYLSRKWHEPWAGQKRLLLVGDSTTYGRGANPLGTAGVTGAHVASPSRLLAEYMTNNGVKADSHSVVGMGANSLASSTEEYFSATPDVSVTLNGWGLLSYISIGGNIFQENTSESNIMAIAFDNVDKAAIGIPIRAYDTLNYRVDGGSWVSVSENGTDDLLRVSIDFGSVGAHTVEFSRTGSSYGGNAFVCYVEAWNSASKLVVVPWGARGYTSTNINQTTRPWSYKSALAKVPFDAVILNIGINDIRSGGAGTTQATYETNVSAYIDAIKAANANALIFLQIPNDIDTGLSYLTTSIPSLAAANGCVLLNSLHAPGMSDYATAVAGSKMYDTLHPNDVGYKSIWNYCLSGIRAAMASAWGIKWNKI